MRLFAMCVTALTALSVAPVSAAWREKPITEPGLRSGLMITGGEIWPLFTRPISGLFMAVCVIMVIWQGYSEFKQPRRVAEHG